MIVKAEPMIQSYDRPRSIECLEGRRIHFMGAGGIGVSALMELAKSRGAIVSGCDCSSAGQVAHLREAGIEVRNGHHPSHIKDMDELVYTPAVPDDHPEILQARKLRVPTTLRMEFLGRLMKGPATICVTGSHGKTTLTWMIAHLLIEGGRDPSILVGGVVPSLKSNVRLRQGGGDPWAGEMVVEVDESDNRLVQVAPVLPVVTNIDNDHLEHYGSLDALEAAITEFLCSTQRTDEKAVLTGCGDDERVLRALKRASKKTGLAVLDYGFHADRSFRATTIRNQGMVSKFDCMGPFGEWKDLQMPVPGRHNVMNILGAIAIAWHLGLDEKTIRAGLSSCERVERRFEVKGLIDGVRIVDDYGHHPVEVAATVNVAKSSSKGRVGVLFQPHRYTRTLTLGADFARCFADSNPDALWLLPVYAASEEPIEGGTSPDLLARIKAQGFNNVYHANSIAEAVAESKSWARDGDTLLIQGAGDITTAAEMLMSNQG